MNLTMASSIAFLILAVVLATLVYFHLRVATSIWRNSVPTRALIEVAGLSLLTTVVWLVVAWFGYLLVAMSSETPSWARMFAITLGLPLNNLCDVLALFFSSVAPTSCDVPLQFILPVFLFVLGLLPFAIKSKAPPRRQRTP
jgi:hypothetical protein